MDYNKILDELRERLRQEEIKTQNYIQGYSDAIGEAMYIIEKQAKQIKKSDTCQQFK